MFYLKPIMKKILYSVLDMSLIENIKNCFNYNEIPNEPNFRAVLFGENAMYLENVRSIAKYDQEQIIVSLKDGGLDISGKGLLIKKYCGGDLVVCGKIKRIEKI